MNAEFEAVKHAAINKLYNPESPYHSLFMKLQYEDLLVYKPNIGKKGCKIILLQTLGVDKEKCGDTYFHTIDRELNSLLQAIKSVSNGQFNFVKERPVTIRHCKVKNKIVEDLVDITEEEQALFDWYFPQAIRNIAGKNKKCGQHVINLTLPMIKTYYKTGDMSWLCEKGAIGTDKFRDEIYKVLIELARISSGRLKFYRDEQVQAVFKDVRTK